MTLALSGHVVEAGIAIGRAHNLQRNEIEIGEYVISAARGQPMKSNACARQPSQTHQHLVESGRARARSRPEVRLRKSSAHTSSCWRISSLVAGRCSDISSRALCNAEWAMQLQLEALLEGFRAIDDAYIRSRADDAAQVVRMVQQALLSEPQTAR